MESFYGKTRPGDGIKAQGEAAHWWSKRWLDLLTSFGWASRMARGRLYARKGQVLEHSLEPGLVIARVQGSAPEPYDVEIGIKVLDDKTWESALHEIAQRAVFSAMLLNNRMPDNIEEAFPDKKPLLPTTARQFQMHCSCPDFANPCKHLASVFYVLAEEFDRDPFLIFLLRGRTREQVLGELAQPESAPPEEPPTPLDMTRFWDDPPEMPPLPPKGKLECSLLRRLGAPFPGADEEAMLKAWLPLYRQLRSDS